MRAASISDLTMVEGRLGCSFRPEEEYCEENTGLGIDCSFARRSRLAACDLMKLGETSKRQQARPDSRDVDESLTSRIQDLMKFPHNSSRLRSTPLVYLMKEAAAGAALTASMLGEERKLARNGRIQNFLSKHLALPSHATISAAFHSLCT